MILLAFLLGKWYFVLTGQSRPAFSQKETALTKWQGRFFFHIAQMQFYDTPGGGIFLPRQRIDFSQMQLAHSFCAARRTQ